MKNTDSLNLSFKTISKADVLDKIKSMIEEFRTFLGERKKTYYFEQFNLCLDIQSQIDFINDNAEKFSNKPRYDEFYNAPNYLNDKSFYNVLTQTISIYNEAEDFVLITLEDLNDYVMSIYIETNKDIFNALPKVIFDNINWESIVDNHTSEFGANDYLGKNYYIIVK